MANLKTYLRNFSKTLGILRPFNNIVSYNFTQANNDVVAPFDGYMAVSINCRHFWINAFPIEGFSSVFSEQWRSELGNQGSTIPVKKGYTYHIETDWSSERNQVAFFPLINTN